MGCSSIQSLWRIIANRWTSNQSFHLRFCASWRFVRNGKTFYAEKHRPFLQRPPVLCAYLALLPFASTFFCFFQSFSLPFFSFFFLPFFLFIPDLRPKASHWLLQSIIFPPHAWTSSAHRMRFHLNQGGKQEIILHQIRDTFNVRVASSSHRKLYSRNYICRLCPDKSNILTAVAV